jgi:hypothetical protein
MIDLAMRTILNKKRMKEEELKESGFPPLPISPTCILELELILQLWSATSVRLPLYDLG